MNRFLINCAWDIMDLGKANGVDNSVARDMFVENLATFGTDLVTAQKAYVETLEGWGNLSREEQAEEADWFALKVAPYDKGLQYARLTGDRALFESILASR